LALGWQGEIDRLLVNGLGANGLRRCRLKTWRLHRIWCRAAAEIGTVVSLRARALQAQQTKNQNRNQSEDTFDHIGFPSDHRPLS
jgi:hypothetical protein